MRYLLNAPLALAAFFQLSFTSLALMAGPWAGWEDGPCISTGGPMVNGTSVLTRRTKFIRIIPGRHRKRPTQDPGLHTDPGAPGTRLRDAPASEGGHYRSKARASLKTGHYTSEEIRGGLVHTPGAKDSRRSATSEMVSTGTLT